MKKVLAKGLALAFAGSLLVAGNALANSFASTGVVDANYLNSWDETKAEGTALYSFYVDTPGVYVDSAKIEFENDVFDISLIDVGSFEVIAPKDWVTEFVYTIVNTNDGLTGELDIYFASAGLTGTLVDIDNDPIQITFDYTLLGVDRYTDASGIGWDWDEGQAWGQAYQLFGDDGVTDYENLTGIKDSSAGSTAPVPEPATMLLFGSGLAGLAGYRRKKAAKK